MVQRQHNKGQLILKKLKMLEVDNPLRVKISSEVAQFFKENDRITNGFSVDVKDLFYLA